MPCLVACYDSLRSCFNPKSISFAPWNRHRQDCHEYYYSKFLAGPEPEIGPGDETIGRIDRKRDEKEICIKATNREDLNDYTILDAIPAAERFEMVKNALTKIAENRCIGSMVGMAVADALGHPFEFLPATDTPGQSFFDLKTMTFKGEFNKFRLERGQWTDDASMGLCIADSLIMHKGFNGSDMRIRFWCWWYRGYNNAFRNDKKRRMGNSSVGLGGNISKSLAVLCDAKDIRNVPPEYGANTEDSGNGSLMRLTPVPIFLHGAPLEEVYDMARKSSYTTHPGSIAAESCALLAHLIVRAVNLPDGAVNVKDFLDRETVEYYNASGISKKPKALAELMKWLVFSKPERDTERCWNWKHENLDIAKTLQARGRSYNGYPVSAEYFGSYCMDGLALALWSVYHTTSFDEALTRSINLLGDADSHGSITGQLAGALYGYSSINAQFLKWLKPWDDDGFAVRAVMLHHLGSQRP